MTLLLTLYRSAFKEFLGMGNYMFAIKVSSDAITFSTEVPTSAQIKSQKVVLILKARNSNDNTAPTIDDSNISREVVMMELNKGILQNLFLVCNVSN